MRRSHFKLLFYLNSCTLIESFSSTRHLDTTLSRSSSKCLPTQLNYATSPASLPDSSDPYVILNVQPGADPTEIKRAYRKLVLIHHPDTHMEENKAKAGENFARLNAAYAYLTGKSDKLPKDPYRNTNKTKHKKEQRAYPSWNHPGTRKDYHAQVHMRDSSRNKYKYTPQYSTTKTTTTSSSYSFDPELYISEGWFSNYNPEQPSQYSPPRPPWNQSDNHIRDFSAWAQVRDFDLQGNPIDRQYRPDFRPNTPFTQQPIYTQKNANHDFGAVYAQRQKFDNISSPQTASYTNRKFSYNDLVKDFATFAKVRDYDSDGNPIDNQGGSSNDQEILYEVINDRFMREFEEYNQKIRNNKRNEGASSHVEEIPVQVHDQRNNANDQRHHVQYQSYKSPHTQEVIDHHSNRRSVDAFGSYDMNPVETIKMMTSQPQWNHDQVRSFDIDGNPIDINPSFQSNNRHHSFHADTPFQEPLDESRSAHGSHFRPRVNINIDQVQGYDINGNPIFRDMSLYDQPEYETGSNIYSAAVNSYKNQQHRTESVQGPSPTNVQAYDIHGNNIDRPNGGNFSADNRRKDSVYHQPGRI
jgi:curved DNA-binding protein CbpA